MNKWVTTMLCLLSCFIYTAAQAEQFEQIGDYEVHYIVIPTTFIKPEIASHYNIDRGKNRALVNVSILDSDNHASPALVSGTSRNLLEQSQTLNFIEVREQNAIYYLAQLRHADEEHHRIRLVVTMPDGASGEISFRQKMYWKH